jgi:hypothetical protein
MENDLVTKIQRIVAHSTNTSAITRSITDVFKNLDTNVDLKLEPNSVADTIDDDVNKKKHVIVRYKFFPVPSDLRNVANYRLITEGYLSFAINTYQMAVASFLTKLWFGCKNTLFICDHGGGLRVVSDKSYVLTYS